MRAFVTQADLWLPCGILAGWLMASLAARAAGLSARQTHGLVLGGLLMVYATSVLFTAATAGHTAAAEWHEWLRPRSSVFIALAALSLYAAIFCRWQRLPFRHVADIGAPAFLLVIACARVGCFVRGCCWGDVCCDPAQVAGLSDADAACVYTIPALCASTWPLAVIFPRGSMAYMQHAILGLLPGPQAHSLPCHPVQLYEAAVAACLAVVALWLLPRRRFPVQVATLCLAGYALARFVLEFVRADHAIIWWRFTAAQMASLACVVIAVVWYWRAARQAGRSRR